MQNLSLKEESTKLNVSFAQLGRYCPMWLIVPQKIDVQLGELMTWFQNINLLIVSKHYILSIPIKQKYKDFIMTP